MKTLVIPCREDNYAYLLLCEKTMECVVIDPSMPEPVLKEIEKQGAHIKAIWNTHHHYDHVEGNVPLLERFAGIEVIGHESDRGRIPGQTQFVKDGQILRVGEEIQASVVFNPGHTAGAISFYVKKPAMLFVGDTLFGAGCGYLFEGSPGDMHASLQKLCNFAGETRIYCGHEYTLANLRFASLVEPDNLAIGDRMVAVEKKRALGQDSMGFCVAEELATNVFVRTEQAQVQAFAKKVAPDAPRISGVDIFAILRKQKDSFS